MSYEKAMKWNRKHPKGTRQPMLMHTESGFTPSLSYLDEYFKYRALCEIAGIEPAECKEYYYNSREHNQTLREAQEKMPPIINGQIPINL
jgi:hypothetical protein